MGAPMRGDDPALRNAEQIVAADAGIVTSGTGTRGPEEADVPPTLKYDLDLFLHLLRQVLSEYDAGLLDMFDQLLVKVIRSSRLSDLGSEEAKRAFFARYLELVERVDDGILVDSTGVPNVAQMPLTAVVSNHNAWRTRDAG